MLRSKLIDTFSVISMVQTTPYISTVGEALKSTIQNLFSRDSGLTPNVDDATQEQVLAAVTDSVEAMADDILVSLATAALTQSNATEMQPVGYAMLRFEIGEYLFVIAEVVYQRRPNGCRCCNSPLKALVVYARFRLCRPWCHGDCCITWGGTEGFNNG